MTINNEYSIGDIVYHKVRSEQIKGMITGFQVRENLQISYYVCWENNLFENLCSGFELTSEKSYSDENM